MYQKELEAMIAAAKLAEVKIKEIYSKPFEVEIKSDDSPVTAADKAADAIIRESLGKQFPDYGFLTEESVDTPERLSKRCIFIVDPVDGTKEFVAHNGEFTTNIALAVDKEVVAGVINVPIRGEIYYASKGDGAFKMDSFGNLTRLSVSDKTTDLTVYLSRSFLKEEEVAMIEKNKDKIAHRETIGAALKFCYIAEGKGEISFRLSQNTKEWDVAAGEIILREAGGDMLKPDGTHYEYNRVDPYNRAGYMLFNKKANFFFDK